MNLNDSVTATKEIMDIVNDYQKTKFLLEAGKWDELENHIQEVIRKHTMEAMAYNAIASVPPQTLQQHAHNCMQFLKILLWEKGFKNLAEIYQ